MSNYQCAEWGLQIVPREVFMHGPLPVPVYPLGEPSEFDSVEPSRAIEAGERALAGLRERAAQYPGAFVVYDPEDDEDGWLLVGDDADELDRQSCERMQDGASDGQPDEAQEWESYDPDC